MNTLIIYGFEEESLTVLVDEEQNVLQTDYADGMMWTLESSLIKIFGEDAGEELYTVLATDNNIDLAHYNLRKCIVHILDEISFNLIKKGLTE